MRINLKPIRLININFINKNRFYRRVQRLIVAHFYFDAFADVSVAFLLVCGNLSQKDNKVTILIKYNNNSESNDQANQLN
jgi:hypothetical protein